MYRLICDGLGCSSSGIIDCDFLISLVISKLGRVLFIVKFRVLILLMVGFLYDIFSSVRLCLKSLILVESMFFDWEEFFVGDVVVIVLFGVSWIGCLVVVVYFVRVKMKKRW